MRGIDWGSIVQLLIDMNERIKLISRQHIVNIAHYPRIGNIAGFIEDYCQ